MYSIASQICRMKIEQAFSVRMNLSSNTRSNSSPPSILWKNLRLALIVCLCLHYLKYVQLENNANHFVILKSIIELNDFGMLQAVHHFDLTFNIFTLLSVGNGNEFRRQT